MAVHAVIPARLASTRLPDKPLADIHGQPMILRVAQAVSRAEVDTVVVAVDHPAVAEVVQAGGYRCCMTRQDHLSGSDRIYEVAQQSGWPDDDIVINVQGDEPLLPAAVVNDLARAMQSRPNLLMATVSEPLTDADEFLDPNIVKVVTNQDSNALYFSRAPIPYPRDQMLPDGASDKLNIAQLGVRRHVGIYGFRVQGLRQFVDLGATSGLEHIEKLEQLRWLQAGFTMYVLPQAESVPGGVDTPEDLARIRAAWPLK